MNKNIFKSIFVIIAIIFMASSIFAETTKKDIPAVCQNRSYRAIEKLKGWELAAGGAAIGTYSFFTKTVPIDLRIRDVKFYKYTKTENAKICAKVIVKTNYSSPDTHTPISYAFAIPLTDKSQYPWLIERLYEKNKEGQGLVESISSGHAIAISPKPSEVKSVSGGYEYTFNIDRGAHPNLCSAYDTGRSDLDIYVFRPMWYLYAKWQDDVDVCVTNGSAFKKIDWYDLDGDQKKLINTSEDLFFYNVDYKYGVQATKEPTTPTATPSGTPSGTKNPENTSGSNGDNAGSTTTTSSLSYNTLKYVSQVKYSVNANNWIDARTYIQRYTDNNKTTVVSIIDHKGSNKTVNITLPAEFKADKDTYVIIAPSIKESWINDELRNIIINNKFEGYTLQTNYALSTKLAKAEKLSYKASSFNFTLATNADEKLDIVFLQKSDDNTKINISHTHLFVLDDKEQSMLYLCGINSNILYFYCKGYNCNIPSCIDSLFKNSGEITDATASVRLWDEEPATDDYSEAVPPENDIVTARRVETADTNPEPTSTPTTAITGNCNKNTQTLDQYTTCLIDNLQVWNKDQKYSLSGTSKLGTQLMADKFSSTNINACLNNSTFNDLIFAKAKALGLSEEETAQFWSRVAAESGCNVSCGTGGCGSSGIGQIEISAWNTESSYNLIKSQLIKINSTRYGTFNSYLTNLNKNPTNSDISLELSTAIDRTNAANLFKQNVWTRAMETTYDHDDSIDFEFAKAYLYCAPAKISYFSGGPTSNKTINKGCAYTAFHKTGYYIGYKREIYQCSKAVRTNAFVTAYKTKYDNGASKFCK